MSKKYRLLKDLPDSKAGDIYEWVECIGVKNGGVYYLYGDVRLSYWQKGNVENNPEWFAEVVTSSTIEIKAEMPYHKAWIAFYNACKDVGINTPTLCPGEGEAIDLLAAKGYTILKSGEDWITKADLEACWNAARMKDPFSRAISQPFKFDTFKDYMAKKASQNENHKQ